MRSRNVVWSAFMSLNGNLPDLLKPPGRPCEFPWRLPCTASTATEEYQGWINQTVRLCKRGSIISRFKGIILPLLQVRTANNTAKLVVALNIHEKPTETNAAGIAVQYCRVLQLRPVVPQVCRTVISG
jgi:hypothetical protein